MKAIVAIDPDANRMLATWLAKQLGFSRPFREPYRTMGVFDDSELIAVVLWENYRPEDGTVEIAAASTSRRWLTRSVLRKIADHTYGFLGCQMAVFSVPEFNHTARRFLEHAGIPFTVIPRLRGRDQAEILFHLTDTDWHQSPLGRREKTNA